MVLAPPLAAAAAFSSPRGRCPLLLLLQPPPTSPSSSPPSPPFAVAAVHYAPATDITLNGGRPQGCLVSRPIAASTALSTSAFPLSVVAAGARTELLVCLEKRKIRNRFVLLEK